MTPTITPEAARLAEEALPALRRAMQALSDNIRRRQGAEQVREGIQRAMFDLQTVHMALSAPVKQDAAPTSASTVPEWMPIETAPKDGTELLLWREDCGQFIGSYTSGDNFPLTQDEIDMMAEEVLFQKDWFTQWPDARRLEGSELPTLWQRLPRNPGACSVTDGEAKK